MTEHDICLLSRIRFVLVETSLSGNQGAVARAMKTMGLSKLALVRPRHLPDAQALARAAGADELLHQAGHYEDLAAALGNSRLVIGSSARPRHLSWPELSPEDAAKRLLAEAAVGEVALVFGRESSGLSNDELAHCHYLTRIPANPEFSSLNLGAAAQLFAYEIRRAWLADALPPADDLRPDVAGAEALDGFFNHLQQTLVALGFANPEQSHKLERRLRRLFLRARPDRTELNILRGILNAALGSKTSDRFYR